MPNKLKRVSLTVPEYLVNILDNYIRIKKEVDSSISRSSIISDLLERHIPQNA